MWVGLGAVGEVTLLHTVIQDPDFFFHGLIIHWGLRATHWNPERGREESGTWAVFTRLGPEVYHARPNATAQNSVVRSHQSAGKAGQCNAVFPGGKERQFGGKVSGDLNEDQKRLLARQREAGNRRKWYWMKGEGTKPGGSSFDFHLPTWNMGITSGQRPLGSGRGGYDAPRWEVTQVLQPLWGLDSSRSFCLHRV